MSLVLPHPKPRGGVIEGRPPPVSEKWCGNPVGLRGVISGAGRGQVGPRLLCRTGKVDFVDQKLRL